MSQALRIYARYCVFQSLCIHSFIIICYFHIRQLLYEYNEYVSKGILNTIQSVLVYLRDRQIIVPLIFLLKFSKPHFNAFSIVSRSPIFKECTHPLFHKVQVDTCKRCAQKLIRVDQNFVSCKQSSCHDQTSHCFSDVEHLGFCEICNTPSLISDIYYCCLPKSIFLCPLQQYSNNQNLVEEFDLNASMKSAFVILNTEFRWSRFMVLDFYYVCI